MADETNKVETPKDVLIATDTEAGLEFWMAEFTSGDAKNLKYAYPKIVDWTKASVKYGADKLMEMANAILKNRIATKVRNTTLPDTGNEARDKEEYEKLRRLHPDGVIFTAEDAAAYKVGERESGLKEQLEDARRELVDILVAGNQPGPELIAKVAGLQSRIDARKREKVAA